MDVFTPAGASSPAALKELQKDKAENGNQVASVVAPMALALVSRGSFDAPLCALCAAAAAQWAALASVDERGMWRALMLDRARRLKDAGEDNANRAELAKSAGGP